MWTLGESPPIPPMDRFGIPGHWAIFLALYHVTFVVHLLLMNFSLGGAVVCLVNDVRGFFAKDRDYLVGLNRRIYAALPVSISLAITFGVAPLLFVQVLYGQFFYTANILVGLPWFALVVVLMAAFYLVYLVSFGRESPIQAPPLAAGTGTDAEGAGGGATSQVVRTVISLVIVGCLAAVALLHTANAVWSIIPEQWLGRYEGNWLQWPWPPEAHFWPRLAHNLIGATAVACVLLAAGAWVLLARGAVERAWAVRTVRGLLLAGAVLTLAQMADGVTMVWLLERGVRGVMVASGGVVHVWGWRLGVLAAVGAVVCMARGAARPAEPRWTWRALGLVVLALGGMSMGREAVRAAYVEPYFRLAEWSGRTVWQVSAMAMFAASFVVALAAVGWMVWIAWRTPPARPGPGESTRKPA